MQLPIVAPAPVVNEHTASFRHLFNDERAYQHFQYYLTGLIRGGETLRIRIAFKNFPGKSVYHCHILDHEELDMMGVIEVV